MLSDVFENAKDMMADVYLADVSQTYVCTIANKQQALLFEGRKNRPQDYKVVFRTKDGAVLCTRQFRKMEIKLEKLTSKHYGNRN